MHTGRHALFNASYSRCRQPGPAYGVSLCACVVIALIQWSSDALAYSGGMVDSSLLTTSSFRPGHTLTRLRPCAYFPVGLCYCIVSSNGFNAQTNAQHRTIIEIIIELSRVLANCDSQVASHQGNETHTVFKNCSLCSADVIWRATLTIALLISDIEYKDR